MYYLLVRSHTPSCSSLVTTLFSNDIIFFSFSNQNIKQGGILWCPSMMWLILKLPYFKLLMLFLISPYLKEKMER